MIKLKRVERFPNEKGEARIKRVTEGYQEAINHSELMNKDVPAPPEVPLEDDEMEEVISELWVNFSDIKRMERGEDKITVIYFYGDVSGFDTAYVLQTPRAVRELHFLNLIKLNEIRSTISYSNSKSDI